MLALSGVDDGKPVSVRQLADEMEVPYAFARGIQRDLVTAGLATTRRGVAGGLMLSRRPRDITMLDVVEAMEGPVALNICTSDPEWCSRMGTCSAHRVWGEANKLLRDYLGSKTLEDMAC